MPSCSRYVVGIDLGTTNSRGGVRRYGTGKWRGGYLRRAAAHGSRHRSRPGDVAVVSLRACPPASSRRNWLRLRRGSDANTEKGQALFVVGRFARDHGETVPGRLIASAKSWLCHAGVDRTAELLPWHGADDVTQLSPVDSAARYLEHFRRAWNHKFPNDLARTAGCGRHAAGTPFDEVARELTVRAAKLAGLPRIVLLEEPQAAFYAWIAAHRDAWSTVVSAGQKILVCDIGGGTSDFTLIRVRAARRRPRAVPARRRRRASDTRRRQFGPGSAHSLKRNFRATHVSTAGRGACCCEVVGVKETLLGPNPPGDADRERRGGRLATDRRRPDRRGHRRRSAAGTRRWVSAELQTRGSTADRRSGFQEFGPAVRALMRR